MSKILNITNGDCAVSVMKKADISGDFLPWRDLLHEGPVPANISLEALSKVRADFIINRGWGTADKIKQDFIDRDNKLKSFEKYDKVILWFEHDLYDQLQLLQLLDWFNNKQLSQISLVLICTDDYLGLLPPECIKSLVAKQQNVTSIQLDLGSKAWRAFREKSPMAWFALLSQDTSALPFLHDAILRMLEEYPSVINGLSRTEQQALSIINKGGFCAKDVFQQNQALEQSMFMGDLGFSVILDKFLTASSPLIKFVEDRKMKNVSNEKQVLSITLLGKRVLTGESNWLDFYPCRHWIGGVSLGVNTIYCWDSICSEIKLNNKPF